MKIFLVCLKHPKFSTVLFNVLINCAFFNALMIVNNIITTIMEIKGKVNTDTINVHKGELMEYKNQTENRAFREMLQAAVKRLQNRSGEEIAAKSGAVFHSSRNVLEVLSFYETIEIQLPEFRINSNVDEWHYLTLLHYLDMADGTEGSQKLITFGNLKDGLIRGTKFDRTAEQKLEKLLQEVSRWADERKRAYGRNTPRV